ncbi:MAG: serine hydrolase domain-containing protein [Pikeienuella sp.]
MVDQADTSGIMRGFPPAEGQRATLANWRNRPFNAWSFQHVRELIPSADIAHDPENIRDFPLGQLDVAGLGIEAVMADTDTDAVVVLRGGELVYESYRNGMDQNSHHILMSVSKSILGLIAGTLVDRGEIDLDALVTDWIPEVADTAYKGATIRQLLDMRAGVLFEEDYLATEGPIIEYRYAMNWNQLPPGRSPGDLRSFFSCLTETDGPHEGRFHYVSPNTDLLGWVFERATGQRYADMLSERLWKPMGAGAPAYITVDPIGAPRAAGGLCMTARDLARIGAVMADEGGGVIPKGWINDILTNGDPDAWDRGDFSDHFVGQSMHYRSKWYVARGDKPMIHALGIHGQYLFVDPARDLSISWFSSQHDPLNEEATGKTLALVYAIRERCD